MYLKFTDKDTAAVNNYEFTLLNDKEKLFNFECNKSSDYTVESHTEIPCSKWQLFLFNNGVSVAET